MYLALMYTVWSVYTGYTQKNGAENWLLPQLNTNYEALVFNNHAVTLA